MKKNKAITFAGGMALSVAALYFALRNVPMAELLAYLGNIDLFWASVSVGVAMASFAFRTYRWQVILGNRLNIGFWQAYHPLIIGFMINCVLPGRVGEVVRPVVLRQQSRVPFSTGIATVAVERVFDILLLIGLFAWVISTVEIDPGFDIPFGEYHLNRRMLMLIAKGVLNLSLVLVAGIVLVSFDRTRHWMTRIILAGPALFFFAGEGFRDRVKRKIALPMTALMDSFAAGFSQVKNPRTVLWCLVLSAAVWGLAGLSYWVMAKGCPGMDLSFPEAVSMMVIICIFIALPSVPGYWGIWEAGGVFALYLFGVPNTDAAGFTLANHAVQILPVMLLGIVSAVALGIDVRKISQKEPV